MKAAQLRDKTVEELREKERELCEQLFALRLQKVTGQLEKPSRIRDVPRHLARVLTILPEKRASQAEEKDEAGGQKVQARTPAERGAPGRPSRAGPTAD